MLLINRYEIFYQAGSTTAATVTVHTGPCTPFLFNYYKDSTNKSKRQVFFLTFYFYSIHALVEHPQPRLLQRELVLVHRRGNAGTAQPAFPDFDGVKQAFALFLIDAEGVFTRYFHGGNLLLSIGKQLLLGNIRSY